MAAIARQLDLTATTVRLWIRRFNRKGLAIEGLAGQAGEPRSGAPSTHPPEQVGEMIATSLTNPTRLGLPFGCWSLDRLAAYLHEERGIAIERSRLGELLVAEGLKRRTQETWFGERADPAFAEKWGH